MIPHAVRFQTKGLAPVVDTRPKQRDCAWSAPRLLQEKRNGMSFSWKSTIKQVNELFPPNRGPHEANNGVEMLCQRWMAYIFRKPLMMPDAAVPTIVFRIKIFQFFYDSWREPFIDDIGRISPNDARPSHGKWVIAPSFQPKHFFVELIRESFGPGGEFGTQVFIKDRLERHSVTNFLISGSFINQGDNADMRQASHQHFSSLRLIELLGLQRPGVAGLQPDLTGGGENRGVKPGDCSRAIEVLNRNQGPIQHFVGNEGFQPFWRQKEGGRGPCLGQRFFQPLRGATTRAKQGIRDAIFGKNPAPIIENGARDADIANHKLPLMRGLWDAPSGRRCRMGNLRAFLRREFLSAGHTTGGIGTLFHHACILLK